jgi:methanogenic corrinoid protein MtbC1
MSAEEMNDKILSLSQAQAQQERLINDLIHSMVEIDIEAFESSLDEYIQLKGIEKTILQIIFPFLERIGILWLTNHINPAQEHMATNAIRQKLIMGIESLKTTVTRKKSILLFLPEGEHHELGLLFMYYLLKSRAIKVYYLGTNVPLKDVEFVAKVKTVDLLYTHLTSVAHNFNLEKFLINAHNRMPDRKLIISGILTKSYTKKVPANMLFIKSISEVMDYIATL